METNPVSASPGPCAKRLAWITPTRYLLVLLAAEAALFASERHQWFAFNQHKNWTVLITLAVAAGGFLAMVAWFGIRLLLRRSVQFDLVTMLVLIFVLAIPCAWFADARQRVENERLAVHWIENLDGGVSYQTHAGNGMYTRDDASFVTIGTYCGPPRQPQWLRKLLGDEFFDKEMRGVELGDRFPSEEKDEQALQRPRSYFEEKYDITNRELVHLSHFYDLEQLGICSRKVTDAGLRSIHGLRRLKKLTLVTPNVTPQGIARLRRQLPHCEIVQYDDIVVPPVEPVRVEVDGL